MTNLFVTLLPSFIFTALAGWSTLLRLSSRVSEEARGHAVGPNSQTKWAPIGTWFARILPGVLLAGYISWMTIPRVHSIEPRMVARADTAVIAAPRSAWLSRLGKLSSWIVTTIAALLLLVFILWMTLPRIFNVQGLIVLSGSMEPTLPVGSVAFINDAGASSVEIGDIITFRRQEGGRHVLVTHRVIEVVPDDKATSFRTQGDANSAPDDWVVPEDTVVGEVTRVIPYMGYVTDKIRGRNGFLLLMAIPGALIIAGEIRKIGHELGVIRRKGSAA